MFSVGGGGYPCLTLCPIAKPGTQFNDGTGSTNTYDAEGNVIGINGTTYTYDALNQRVMSVDASGTTTRWGFDLAGRRATNYTDNFGTVDAAHYYAGSQPLAYWTVWDNHMHFQHQDWMGTERLRTDHTGATEGTFTFYVLGDNFADSGRDDNQGHYAGLDHDGDPAGLNQHATFCNYHSNKGR